MRYLAAFLLLLLAACGGDPVGGDAEPAPALWEISDTKGEPVGWLFGTIHALPSGTRWRTARLDEALAAADILAVEIDLEDDRADVAQLFARLAATPGLPPLSQRVAPRFRDELARLMQRGGLKDGHFRSTETWAAALTLSNVDSGNDSENGVDRLLARDFDGPLVELEGFENQLSIFDLMPEPTQRALLDAIVEDADDDEAERRKYANLWRSGDTDAIAAEADGGMLANPGLRKALVTDRNRDWAEKIDALIRSGRKTFVAAGTGHMIGADSVPQMLAARGYTVRRIQ